MLQANEDSQSQTTRSSWTFMTSMLAAGKDGSTTNEAIATNDKAYATHMFFEHVPTQFNPMSLLVAGFGTANSGSPHQTAYTISLKRLGIDTLKL